MNIASLLKTDFEKIKSTTSSDEIRKFIQKYGVVAVLDEKKYLGLISSSELIRKNYQVALDYMNEESFIDYNSSIHEALELMEQYETSALCVRQKDNILGVICKEDIIKSLSMTVVKAQRHVRELMHDIKNPLHAMKAITDLLKESTVHEDDRELINYYERALNSAFSILESTEHLFQNLSKEYKNVILSDFIRKQLEPYKAIIEKKMYKVTVTEKISSPEFKAVVKIAESDLGRIIDNLFINSFKFTPEGGKIAFRVRSKMINNKKLTYLLVSDNGIGIPKEIKQYLFVKNQLTTRTGLDGQKPSGMGLKIVQNLLAEYNYSIKIKSLEGRGTTMIIMLFNDSIKDLGI